MNKTLSQLQKYWITVCLFNFFIAALMGTILRYGFVSNIPFNFKHLTHGHSHIAMLGWVYLILYTFIVHQFIPQKKQIFTYLFWATQLAVVGMMISFPLQGYAAISITFSALHIFCSYYFAFLVWKNQENNTLPEKLLLKSALVFMLLSTVGIWCLGPAVALAGKQSVFYHLAIQFFLHFQFNGWFLLAVFALFFKYLNNLKAVINLKLFNKFYSSLIFATLFTYALPVSWYVSHPALFWINVLGIFLQLVSFWFLIKIILPNFSLIWKNATTIIKKIMVFTCASIGLKILLQTTSLFPEIASISFQIKHLVIGFIHLTMLGVVSGFLLLFLLQSKWFSENKLIPWGINIFFIGFLGTEFLLFIQGGMFYFQFHQIPYYHLLLLLFSCFLLLGITLFFVGILKNIITNTPRERPTN